MHFVGTLTTFALLALALPAPAQVTAPPGSAARPGQVGTQVQPQAPPRDRATIATGTARVRGTVVAADSGAPLRRAMLRLSARDTRQGRSASTDGNGRFEFRDLPAGRYQISASKGGYVLLSFGQRLPHEAGRPIELRAGETLDNVNFSLPRAGVITGRIVDEYGEPVSDAMVQALRSSYLRGRRRYVPAGRFAQSNDIGVYRVFGLPPGEYLISATLSGREFPSEPNQEASGYAPTYYPGTPNVAEAQRVSVAVGQEAGADIQLVPARLAKITGVVSDSAGHPLSRGQVVLTRRFDSGASGENAVVMIGGNSASLQQDGAFTLTGVAPGTYDLVVSSRPGPPMALEAGDRGAEYASVPVTVAGEDLEHVVVQTSRGITIRGRVITEGTPPTFSPSQVNVFLQARDSDGPTMFLAMGGRPAVRDDWTFELTAYPGARVVRVAGVPEGWQLKSVSLGAENVTDAGFEVRAGQPLGTMRIVLTSQITEVTGTVADGRGDPVRDYTVVLFAEDRALLDLPSDRFLRTGRPDQDGRYRIEGLPPGDYLAVAVDSLGQDGSPDPDTLESWRALATSVRLGEGERKAVPLKLALP
jgi:protocatechuate 3,4-dioxygenase beta subunit